MMKNAQKKSHTSFAIRLALVLSVTFTACTAKRAEIFTQGQGTNLDSIATWKDRIIPLKTGELIGTSSSTHAQDSVKITDSVKIMNHFDLVQIKVDDTSIASLIGNPPFRALPNTTGVYSLKIKLTENYLKFYKVALPENLPFEERAYLEETLPDGRIAIPLLGYKVTGYFHIEPVKTSDDQNSHHLTEIGDTDHTKSTHVKIDWSSRQLFEAVKTSDLMPSQIFFSQNKDNGQFKPYEWYYSETVIEKSLNDTNTIVGEAAQSTENSQLVPASKVVFVPRESELRVVNVARDERLSVDQIQNSGDLNSEAALIIPVKWSDYRTKADGTNLSLQGEVVEDHKWSQRNFLELNIPELKSAGITEGTTRLLDLEVDQNYLSFTVLNMIGNTGRKIHYSFLRADQGRAPYKPRQSFKSDRNLFGFFTSEKPFIPNWEYYTEENFNKRIYMSRMNPDSKEIVFHLSADSPAWLEDIAEKAVAAWDKTFQLALKGSGKEIKISFSKDRVLLGDLRYNVIHLVETLNEDGLLGFGPSVADPETGEIISASTNVYVNSTQAIAAGTVRQYMIDRLEKRLGKIPAGQTILSDMEIGSLSGVSPAAKRFLERSKSLQADKKSAEKIATLTLDDVKKDIKSLAKNSCRFAEVAALSSNDRDIQKYCPEIEKYLDQNSSLDVTSRASSNANWEKVWSESKDAIKDCSIKLTRGKLLSTLIHEVGHNFGLRHNFEASYDKGNFKTSKTIFGDEIIAHSSSIMEYTDWDEDRLTETGTYDIAAIRFGYGEQVELKDGSVIKVDPTKIVDNKNLKPYLFCTDEEAYTGLSATCKPHDAGTSPKELVEFYIKGYKRSEMLRKYRRARPMNSDPELIASYNLSNTFLPMKDIYDEWRYFLGEYVRKSARYLSDYSAKDYAGVLDAMSKDPQFSKVYDQYHEAAEMIYGFFKEVAFGPNEYCLIDDHGEKRAIELERLRDLLDESTRGAVAIRSCADASTAADLASVLNAQSPKVIGEIGYPINSYRFEKAQNLSDYERFDVVGNDQTRLYAGLIINHRMENARNILSDFSPNMTDEPSHYVDFAQTLMGRIVEGVDLSAYDVKDAQPIFTQEASLITSFAKFFRAGLYTPGETLSVINRVATGQRLAPFSVYSMTQSDDASQFATVLTINDRQLYAAIKKNHVLAYNLINRFTDINSMLNLKEVPAKAQEQVAGLLIKVVPAAAEIPTKKVEDFVNTVQAMGQIEKAFVGFASCIEEKTPILAQINLILPKVIDDYQAAHTAGDAAEKKFMATKLAPYLKSKLEGKASLFTKENLKSLGPVMAACAQEQSATVLKVNRNRKDYESQKSMILEVLEAYAD